MFCSSGVWIVLLRTGNSFSAQRGGASFQVFQRLCECRQLGSECKAAYMWWCEAAGISCSLESRILAQSPCRKGLVWGTSCDPTSWICNCFPLFIVQLARSLPARVQGYPWRLAYSTLEHGTSLKTLYRKSASLDSPVLLVIKDMDNQVRSACSKGLGLKWQRYEKWSIWSASHTVKWHHTKIRHWYFLLYFLLLKLNLQAGKYINTVIDIHIPPAS